MHNDCHGCLAAPNSLLVGKYACIVIPPPPLFSCGQLSIIAKEHQPLLCLSTETILEIFTLNKLCLQVLTELLNPSGFNSYVATTTTDHYVQQIIPRWPEDIGLIEVLGETKPLPQDTSKQYQQIRLKLEQMQL